MPCKRAVEARVRLLGFVCCSSFHYLSFFLLDVEDRKGKRALSWLLSLPIQFRGIPQHSPLGGSIISSNFPTARETEFRNHKFTFALDPETRLSDTFAKIENIKNHLGVTDYSVSQTSLEQVFLRIGADATEEE